MVLSFYAITFIQPIDKLVSVIIEENVDHLREFRIPIHGGMPPDFSQYKNESLMACTVSLFALIL